MAVGYGTRKNSTFMESEGLICCWSLKNLEVCMCVCACVCVCVCMYMCVHPCVHMCARACVCVSIYVRNVSDNINNISYSKCVVH